MGTAATGVRGCPNPPLVDPPPEPGLNTSCLLQDLDSWWSLSSQPRGDCPVSGSAEERAH